MAYHPFSETESKAPTELAVCIVFLVLTYLSVGARCYVRLCIIKSFGWDDALMVVALVFFNVWAISIIVIAYEFGGGTRVDVIGTAMHWIIVSETFYVITAMMVKLSLGIFFLRIVIKPWQRAMVYTVMILIALTSIFFFFFLIFLCGNPKDYLIRYIYDQCAPRHVQTALAYLSAALGAAADWTYALIPIQIVVQANMDLRSKLSVLSILSLGTAGCVCSTIRLKYIGGLVSPDEFFWNAAMISVWSGIECGAGITAGSLATLRPLVKRWFATVRSLASSSLNNSAGRRNKQAHQNASGSSGGGAGGGRSDDSRRRGRGGGESSGSTANTSTSRSKASLRGQQGNDGRPLTAWPPAGCWEKLGNDNSNSNPGGDSSVDSHDPVTIDSTSLQNDTTSINRKGSDANTTSDFELKDLSRETSHDPLPQQNVLPDQPPPPPLPRAPPSATITDAGGRVAHLSTIDEQLDSPRWEWPRALDSPLEDRCRRDRDRDRTNTTGGRWEWPMTTMTDDARERLLTRPGSSTSTSSRRAAAMATAAAARRECPCDGDVDADVELGRPFTIDAEGRILDASDEDLRARRSRSRGVREVVGRPEAVATRLGW
ncbi:hypothetical protein GTA08_BOTSDO11494 [Neofusicoccum parvum]|nr:hypothetical protein GTA08_BOTSDO11494 [Neofusicoccum parvum]